MKELTLASLKLFLRDLLENRSEVLQSCLVGKVYAVSLAAKWQAIDTLPAALVGGEPLADALKEADVDHDGFTRALFYLTEAYRCLPTATPELRKAARAVRETFASELAEVRDSYAVEASRAIDREPELDQKAAELDALPVVGGTAKSWAAEQVAAGKRLDALLAGRAAATPEARAEAGRLRTTTIAAIGRFRRALADELEGDPQLPRNLDKLIFEYLDELTR